MKLRSFLGTFGLALLAGSAYGIPPHGTLRVGLGATFNSGLTQVFNYLSSGFPSSGSGMDLTWGAVLNGTSAHLCDVSRGVHQTGQMWYTTQQDIRAFTTDFNFQIQTGGYGMTFIIQNSNSTTNPGNGGGLNAQGDSNGLGYFVYQSQSGTTSPYQEPIFQSIAIKFDNTNQNNSAYAGSNPSSIGLYISPGPWVDSGAVPESQVSLASMNLSAGDLMSVHIVYDGSLLTMILKDTVTGSQGRFSWPLNIPAATNSNYAYVGFGCGTVTAATEQITGWSWSTGYGNRLASPTFSVPEGQYASSQSVTLSGPAGSSIYYTTNGLQPTTASTLYTGTAITVSANQYIQAIAVESGYADSLVSSANYQIGASANVINFPSGFASYSGLVNLVGVGTLSGTALQLTDLTHDQETGAAWYVAPVNIGTFTTNFGLQWPTVQAAPNGGAVFVIQNQVPASLDNSVTAAEGGPLVLQSPGGYMGYGSLYGVLHSSIGIKFDLSNNSTALLLNGAAPSSSSVVMTGINLSSGHLMNIQLTYNGATLTESVTDSVTTTNFTTSYTVNIPSIVGGSTAYVGFTGGEGYAATSNQGAVEQVTSWTYHN